MWLRPTGGSYFAAVTMAMIDDAVTRTVIDNAVFILQAVTMTMINDAVFILQAVTMALMDDAVFLVSHIRNSFITSDDTGMCELIIDVDENAEKRPTGSDKRPTTWHGNRRVPHKYSTSCNM